jgi:hypothetical protein
MNELVWDYDQIFNILKDRLTFQILDEQHREWLIARLLLYICFPLMQHKIVSQLEALEISMKLEVSLVEENGTGISHV